MFRSVGITAKEMSGFPKQSRVRVSGQNKDQRSLVRVRGSRILKTPNPEYPPGGELRVGVFGFLFWVPGSGLEIRGNSWIYDFRV